MTAMWSSDVDGIYLTYQVSRVTTRPFDALAICESLDPCIVATYHCNYFMADSFNCRKEYRSNASVPNNPPAHPQSIALSYLVQ